MEQDNPNDEKPWQVSVRIPREIEPRLRHLAKRRGLAPAILLRLLIIERLEEIEREQGGQR